MAIRSALAADAASGSSPHLRVAAGQADRLGSLVGELRALAELETRDIERARMDVAAIAMEEVEALRAELGARRAVRHIAVAFPTAPWPLPPVSGDVDLISVAIRNLLVNAAKYSAEGARIEVRGSEHDGVVVLDVADTGSGIPADEVPHVWDELWRGKSARAVEGTGLGLSLVRIVAERHGGTVSLRSEPGRGTSVQLRLPAA
jgi:two-component system OmpR family sensor kinase